MRSSNKRNEYIASLLTSSGAAGDGHAITQNKGTKPDKTDVRLLQQYGTYEYEYIVAQQRQRQQRGPIYARSGELYVSRHRYILRSSLLSLLMADNKAL